MYITWRSAATGTLISPLARRVPVPVFLVSPYLAYLADDDAECRQLQLTATSCNPQTRVVTPQSRQANRVFVTPIPVSLVVVTRNSEL